MKRKYCNSKENIEQMKEQRMKKIDKNRVEKDFKNRGGKREEKGRIFQ